jgi:hypothetical protein
MNPHIDYYGNKCWLNNKKEFHREDGPAIEALGGDMFGGKFWYINGKRHRIDGPAIEYVGGTKEWFINGKLHRIDGPAIEYCFGAKEWWIDGVRYSEEEFLRIVKMKELL